MSSRRRGFNVETNCDKWHTGTKGKEGRKGLWPFCYLCFPRFHFYQRTWPCQFLSRENYQGIPGIFSSYLLALSSIFLICNSLLSFHLQTFFVWAHHLPQMLLSMTWTLIWSPYSLPFSIIVSSGSSLTVSLTLGKKKKKKSWLCFSNPPPSHSPPFHLQLYRICCLCQSLKSFPPFLP